MSPATLRYFEGLGFFGWQLGLERIEKLCAFYGNPQRRYPSVHLAGTNGKGSTAAILAAIGQAAGLKTGLYTSPHLVHMRERIQINGQPISGEALEGFIRHSRSRLDQLRATYFEALTAIAFAYFAEQKVDLAIIETGLGGKLDATNVITPEVAMITSIGLEHQQYLGTTLAQIAQEKAGIIKRGRPCVSGVKNSSVQKLLAGRCRNADAPFFHAPECARVTKLILEAEASTFRLASRELNLDYPALRLNLIGRHQVDNARMAVVGAHLLHERGLLISGTAVQQGLAQVRWPTRMQLLRTAPPILIDAAHNSESMRILARGIRELFPRRKVRLVMALLQDKSAERVLQAWQELRPRFFFVPVATERGMQPELLAQVARRRRFNCEAHVSPHAGMQAASQDASDRDLIVVAGSHYLLGELMKDGLLPYPYIL